MRGLFLSLSLFLSVLLPAQPAPVATPEKIYGQLFTEVQLNRVFKDSKTFVDCIPLLPPEEIMARYHALCSLPGFALKDFVRAHFRLPAPPPDFTSGRTSLRRHIGQLWSVLKRRADTAVAGSSLLPLPHPYIVPGGRFREVYYWDSYFTMLGLKESGEYQVMEDMVRNFAHLLRRYGHIPNGNRSYYLSRSQPPFFSLMVELLASVKGREVYRQYATELELELDYWTAPAAGAYGAPLVLLAGRQGDTLGLSRYHDGLGIPRQESYREDHATASEARLELMKRVRIADSVKLRRMLDSAYETTCNNLRAAAASGWDFSSRWMRSGALYSTRTSEILPVDLNCLVAHLQATVKKSATGKKNPQDSFATGRRVVDKATLRSMFFNESLGWYCDFDLASGKVMSNPTLAGMYPLFFRMADKKDVPRIVAFLKKHFLKPGGVVTSPLITGQQWDAPNGWAPLQWITIIGLENYGYHQLAREIARRWVGLNKNVFRKTGKLMEKYDVTDLRRPAGGGEYPSQDGFGWTNGVLLALMNRYRL